jgi:hypothetical protein
LPEGFIQRVAKRLRPGSGEGTKAISIVDTTIGRAPTEFTPRAPLTDEDFDDSHSGMPMALANEYGVDMNVLPTPRGILPGVDPDDPNRNIPHYEPDNVAVLNRLFGLRLVDD